MCVARTQESLQLPSSRWYQAMYRSRCGHRLPSSTASPRNVANGADGADSHQTKAPIKRDPITEQLRLPRSALAFDRRSASRGTCPTSSRKRVTCCTLRAAVTLRHLHVVAQDGYVRCGARGSGLVQATVDRAPLSCATNSCSCALTFFLARSSCFFHSLSCGRRRALRSSSDSSSVSSPSSSAVVRWPLDLAVQLGLRASPPPSRRGPHELGHQELDSLWSSGLSLLSRRRARSGCWCPSRRPRPWRRAPSASRSSNLASSQKPATMPRPESAPARPTGSSAALKLCSRSLRGRQRLGVRQVGDELAVRLPPRVEGARTACSRATNTAGRLDERL